MGIDNTQWQSSIGIQTTRSASKIKDTFKSYRANKYLFILLLPTLVYFIIFHYVPMYGILIAFKDYKFKSGIMGSEWVGLKYFKEIFRGDSFITVFKNTIVLSSLKLLVGFPAPIILALLLNELKSQKFKKTVQTISYLPHFLSWVILSGIVIQLLSPSIGPIAHIRKSLGLEPIFYLADVRRIRPVLILTSLWKGVGWGTIVYLAGIANVDTELYEAATVDGAGRFKKAIHITLPALVPIITFIFIMSIGSIINDDFDQIMNLASNPAIQQVTEVISTYTYKMGLVKMQYSYSTAVGLFKNIISISLVLVTNMITKKISDNEYGIF